MIKLILLQFELKIYNIDLIQNEKNLLFLQRFGMFAYFKKHSINLNTAKITKLFQKDVKEKQ